MQQISISLPDELMAKMKMLIPQQQYNHIVVQLLEKELQMRETTLYQAACEAEADEMLNQEMSDWNVAINDGIEHEAW
ncbi:hypothetical protein [Candidatus Albibeggiatoa sp. nov. BB20]|uniref:hypothetical protein n=1 Tax=Candidatus Albibeggiatoa sp. nov. BB20 TaxID=3162723 RepID=UPI003365A23B